MLTVYEGVGEIHTKLITSQPQNKVEGNINRLNGGDLHYSNNILDHLFFFFLERKGKERGEVSALKLEYLIEELSS